MRRRREWKGMGERNGEEEKARNSPFWLWNKVTSISDSAEWNGMINGDFTLTNRAVPVSYGTMQSTPSLSLEFPPRQRLLQHNQTTSHHSMSLFCKLWMWVFRYTTYVYKYIFIIISYRHCCDVVAQIFPASRVENQSWSWSGTVPFWWSRVGLSSLWEHMITWDKSC